MVSSDCKSFKVAPVTAERGGGLIEPMTALLCVAPVVALIVTSKANCSWTFFVDRRVEGSASQDLTLEVLTWKLGGE